jgi:hypothetical protein
MLAKDGVEANRNETGLISMATARYLVVPRPETFEALTCICSHMFRYVAEYSMPR